MILLFNHSRETGLVKKSLHPAASAATRSLGNEEAVRATMITEERYGEATERVSDAAETSEGVLCPSVVGVSEGKPDEELVFSRRRISFVASIPSMIGIWISIYTGTMSTA